MSAVNHVDAGSVADTLLSVSPAAMKCHERIEFELTVSRRRWWFTALVCLVTGGVMIWNDWVETSVLVFLMASIAAVQIADTTGALKDIRRRRTRYTESPGSSP